MRIPYILALVILLSLSACKKAVSSQFGTPEETFSTLLEAIKNKDIGLYEKCWDPARAEQEGSLSQLSEKPALWDELQALFRGPQELGKGKSSSLADGREKLKFEVKAPEAADGGIGALTMIKNGNQWQMYSW